jgi:hypothetical protein
VEFTDSDVHSDGFSRSCRPSFPQKGPSQHTAQTRSPAITFKQWEHAVLPNNVMPSARKQKQSDMSGIPFEFFKKFEPFPGYHIDVFIPI